MSIINEVKSNINPAPDQEEPVFRTKQLLLVSDVINVHDTYPLTGTYAEERVPGWKWSRTFPQDLNELTSRIETKLDANVTSYEEGSKLNNWQGCVLSNIELKKIKNHYKSLRSKWVPEYSVGEYSLYHKSKRLYSNYSLCAILKEEVIDEEDGSIVDDNSFEGIIKNISIALYKRDKRFVNFPFYKYIYDSNLNEDNSFDIEQDDEDNTTIKINSVKTHQVGGNYDLIDGYPEILNTWEYAGKGYDTRSKIYSEFFPIKEGSLRVVEVLADGSLKKWQEVNREFTFSNKSEFILDNTNGIITINSINPGIKYTVKLVEAVEDDVYKRVVFYEDLKNIKNFKGKIKIEETEFEYYDKFENGFYVAASSVVNSGDEVEFVKEGQDFTNGSDIYIMYEAVPRIDYEVVEEEDLVRSDKDVDLKPYKSSESVGLVEINPFEKHVSQIRLTTNKEQINMGLSARITAEIFNSGGAKVKEVETNFYCDSGYFNNGRKEYTSTSNQDGEAFSYYNWPYEEKFLYMDKWKRNYS